MSLDTKSEDSVENQPHLSCKEQPINLSYIQGVPEVPRMNGPEPIAG